MFLFKTLNVGTHTLEAPQSMFWSKNIKKIGISLAHPSFAI